MISAIDSTPWLVAPVACSVALLRGRNRSGSVLGHICYVRFLLDGSFCGGEVVGVRLGMLRGFLGGRLLFSQWLITATARTVSAFLFKE